MKLKFLGQNCFLFTYKNKTILTDPFYNFGKEKSNFDIASQTIDFILITHAHGDHVADVKEVLENHSEATIIAQPEICGYYQHSKNVDLNFGGLFSIEGLKITMVPASHTSSFPDGTYGGEPSGFIMEWDVNRLYFAGDTGLMSEMEFFPKYYGEITTAILPIGGHYTMDATMASFAASELLKTKKVIACHFDTFPPISINHDEARKSFLDRNTELILPELGEEFEF